MDRNVVIKSLLFKYSERILYQGIAFIVQIILARILSPHDYGTLALLTVFIAISQVFVQSGLNTALIQAKEISEDDYSTVFWVSFGISCALYLVLFFLAPIIANYYCRPELKSVLRVLALILLPGAFNSIQNAKIARELLFKYLMYSTFSATLLSGIVGIIMAYWGYGIWALVFQQLSNQILVCLFMGVFIRWVPRWVFQFNRIRVLFSFGWKLMVSALLDVGYTQLRSLIIGKRYSSESLGFYNRGMQFPQLIVDNLNGSIQSVMLPVLSRSQDDKARMKEMMRRSIVTSSYVIFPLMVGLGVVAEPLVSILLTDKWLPCVPYLRIFCFIFAFYPVHTANLQALNAQGRSDCFLRLEILKKIVGVAALVIVILKFDTAMSIAWSGVVIALISCFINAHPNKRLLGYSYFEQLRDIFPSAVISAIMGAVVYLLKYLPFSNGVILFVQVLIGIACYLLLSEITHLECYLYLKKMFLQFLKNRRKS